MKRKTNTYLIILTILGVAITAGYVYLSFYIAGLTDKTAEIKTEIETMRIKLAHARKLNVSAEKTADERKKVMSYFLEQRQVIDYVTSLESVADSFGLMYTTNSIENTDSDTLSPNNKELLKVSMSLTGKWSSLIRYLSYIESLPYAVHIDKLDISTGGTNSTTVIASSTNKEPSWSMSLIFSTIKNKENAR